ISDQALSHCTFNRTSPLYIPMTNTTSSTTMATNARIITALREADKPARAQMPSAPTPAAQHTACLDACKEHCTHHCAAIASHGPDGSAPECCSECLLF